MLSGYKIMGGIAVNIYFICDDAPSAQAYALGIPVFFLLWCWCRATLVEAPSPDVEEVRLARCMREAVLRYSTISAYFLRPQVNRDFAFRSENLREKAMEQRNFDMRTDFVVSLLGPACQGMYIAFSVPAVLRGRMPLGSFLATMGAIRSICDECGKGFELYRSLMATVGPAQALTRFFNSETDLLSWKALNRKRRAVSSQLAEAQGMSRDEMPILLTDVSFTFEGGRELFRSVHAEVSQGKIVVVSGAHSSGKATLLRLLAHDVFPSSGDVFVPSHLRVLQVSAHAELMERSLLENLTLGLLDPPKPSDVQRVCDILECLGVEQLSRQVEEEYGGERGSEDSASWMNSLTMADVNLLGIARAVVMNPEVMVLHKPLMLFQKETKAQVADMLREHVANRGFKVDPLTAFHRRPRTVILSVDLEEDKHFGDVHWATHVSCNGTVSISLEP